MDKPSKAFALLPAARPGQRGCLGSARLFSYFLSYVKMQNFAQHPGRGVSLLSSIKFHLENIRGSPVQVVKHCPLFLQSLGMDVTPLWHRGHPELVLCSPGHGCSVPQSSSCCWQWALSSTWHHKQPQECSAEHKLVFHLFFSSSVRG